MRYQAAPHTEEKQKKPVRASISVVSSRDGPRAGRGPVKRRCTGVINSCTSRQTVDAAISDGGVKAHPKWKAAKQKGPEPCGVRASLRESLRDARLRATSTRGHLMSLELTTHAQTGCGLGVIRGVQMRRQRQGRRHVETMAEPDAHERSARGGSNAGESQCGVHDGSWSKIAAVGCKGLEKRDGWCRELEATVKSVYGDVNNRDNLFLSCCCF